MAPHHQAKLFTLILTHSVSFEELLLFWLNWDDNWGFCTFDGRLHQCDPSV